MAATVNEHASVLVAILSDIITVTRILFIILSSNKFQRQIRKNDRKNTLKQRKHQTKSQLIYKKHTSHATEAAGIEFFYDPPKNASALVGTNRLVKDRFRRSGSISERSLTKLARCNLGYRSRNLSTVHEKKFLMAISRQWYLMHR